MDLINDNTPGVYAYTVDQAQAIAAAAPTVAAVVFESEQGPVNEPVLITGDPEKFLKQFGPPRPALTNAHECILEFLKTGASVYALRADNGSKYAMATLHSTSNYNEGFSKTGEEDFFPKAALVTSDNDSTVGYKAAGRDMVLLEIGGTITAGNVVITATPGNGAAAVTTTTAFNSDHATTITDFVDDLVTSMASIDADISVELISASYDGIRYIRILSAEGKYLPAFSSFAAGTGGTAKIASKPVFFEVYAISPGVWANRVGFRVREVDYGLQTTKKVELSKAFVTGQTISFSVDGISVGPVSFDTDHATTMAAIKTALSTALADYNILFKIGEQDWKTALGSTPEAPTNISYTIYFRHRDFGEDFTLTATTGGTGTPPTATVSTVVEPDDWTGLFTLEVYLKDDPNTPVETFRCTLHEHVNDFGEQTNISFVVNESGGKSQYIRVRQPTYTLYEAADDTHKARMPGTWADTAQTVLNVHSSVQWLTNGAAGSAVTDTQIMSAMNVFKDREKYPITLFMNAGYTSVNIQKKINEICVARRDCFGVLDMPNTRQGVDAAKEYSDYVLGINSSQCAIYSPDIYAVSEYSPGGRYLPPSGDVCARIAERQAQIRNVGAPAGIENGSISRATKVREDYDHAGQGLLQASNVNPIIQKRGSGIVIWGARTLQRRLSPLSFVPVRLDLNQIERAIVADLDFSVFKANDDTTRFRIKQSITNLLESYRRASVISYYEVVVDGTNNKSYHEAAGQLNVDIILVFVMPAEKIKLVTTITDRQITFQELQATANAA